MKKQEVIFCDYDEIDDLVSRFFGDKVSGFECALDQPNGSYIKVEVDGEVDRDDLLEYFVSGEQDYKTIDLLLNEMHRFDQIEIGTYMINVSW